MQIGISVPARSRALARFLPLLLLIALAPRAATADPLTNVAISPSLTSVVVGDTFDLDVSIADVSDLFDYQFDITFDPTVLQATGITDGLFLSSGGGTSVFGGAFLLTLDNTLGVITILDSLLGPVPPTTGVTGSGILDVLQFTAIAAGSSAIGLNILILDDSFINPIPAATNDGQVQVSPTGTTSVPEPSTLALLATGLAGVFWKNRYRAARAR